MSLPPVSSLSPISLPVTLKISTLLFEQRPDSVGLFSLVPGMQFTSYEELIMHFQGVLLDHVAREPSSPLIGDLLLGHARLGEPKVESSQSRQEQSNLGSVTEREELRRLNDLYEDKFRGLRYVVFVNGRGREEIMRDMRERIDRSSYDDEVRSAIKAMCDIARDRVTKLGVRP
jgi:2-oxo-4-hydroxy-4-carboxy--5-ureidoimidazoline (OHCU) decarboxylase